MPQQVYGSPTGAQALVRVNGSHVVATPLMRKVAAPVAMHRTAAYQPTQNVTLSTPEIRNPLLNVVNFYLPTDYKILNQWIRYYDRFHPVVGNSIDLHGEFPMSNFELVGVDDPSAKALFEDSAQRCDLFQRFLDISREFELIGEVFPFFHWDSEERLFDSLVILNPDYVSVNTVPYAQGAKVQFALVPDEDVKRIVRSNDPRDQEIVSRLDPRLVEASMGGGNYPIDDLYIDMVARRASPYDIRGTSIVLRCLKDLMYEDKLREAQYSIADGMITPRQLWKIGDPQNDWMPTDADLVAFRKMLEAAAHDNNFAIISHHGVNVEYIGPYGKIMPLIPEFEFVTDRILIALYTNKAMVTGQGPTFSNSQAAMQMLQARYLTKRDRIENMCLRKLWIPMALANEFYVPTKAEVDHKIKTTGEKKLMVPRIEWNQRLNLVDDSQKISYLMRLRDKTQVSMKKLCEVLGLDYKQMAKDIVSEENTPFDPNYQDRRKKMEKSPENKKFYEDKKGGEVADLTEEGGEAPAPAPAEEGAAETAPGGGNNANY